MSSHVADIDVMMLVSFSLADEAKAQLESVEYILPLIREYM